MDGHHNKIKIISFCFCIMIGIFALIGTIYFEQDSTAILKSNHLEDFNKGWTVVLENGENLELEPFTYVEQVPFQSTMVLRNILPENLSDHEYLFFRASHQKVRILVEGQVIYQFGQKNPLFGKTPGCAWIMVPLSENMEQKEVVIELLGAYPNYAGRINGFYIGESGTIFQNILLTKLGSLFIGIVLIVMGFGMLTLSIAFKKGRVTRSLFRLGLLATVIGIWSILVLNILQFLVSDVLFLLHAEFFFFGLIMPVSIWFLLSLKHFQEKKIIQIFFYGSIILSITVQVLQILNLMDYLESIWLTHISMGLILIYLSTLGIRDLITKKIHREVKILSFSLIVLLFFWGIDLFCFYFAKPEDEGFFTRIGMLVFIILWAMEIMYNISRIIEKMARTRLLEVMAYEDTMTGLKNRSAFEEKMEFLRNNPIEQPGYIIEFDMNNLKYINDNYGHAKGDLAITTISKIIQDKFEKIGLVYRIGGDEICVIVTRGEHIPEELIQNKIDQITNELRESSQLLEIQLSIASGYAVLNPKIKSNIDEAYKEADRNMYRKKIIMKCMDQ